ITLVSAILTVIAMPTVPASAGHRSPVLTCNGSWTVIGSPDLDRAGNVLQGVWAASATDVWAVGMTYDMNEPVVEHYNGSGWGLVSVPITATEDALHGISGNGSTIWAVGNYLARAGYRMLTLRWNGSSWSRVSTPNIFGP